MRWLGVVVSVVLVSCQKLEVPPQVLLQVPRPAVEGIARIEASVEPGLGATMTLRVTQREVPVLERTFELGLSEAQLTFQPDAGDYRATLEVVRDGALVSLTNADFRVYPSFTLTRHLNRSCLKLARLNDDATEFDCDGVVIDASGAWVPDRLHGETRIARGPTGVVRWVLSGGVLVAETPGGVSNGVAFPTSPYWAASADFAVSGPTMVMLNGQTLELVEWDGREFTAQSSDVLPPPWVPLVAVSRGGQRGIMFGTPLYFDTASIETPHAFCLLEFNEHWRVTACPSWRGVFLREERDGRVLFQSSAELWLVDPLAGDAPEVVRTLDVWERYRLRNTFTSEAPYGLVFGVTEQWPPTVLADGSVRLNDDFSGHDSSVDLAWASNTTETVWAPVP